ncbi:MAG: hypothetical protein JNJ54_23925 [Myxococcaceae bacterium]|nr:hypothetical protein [Myxococcaceae bacterium]
MSARQLALLEKLDFPCTGPVYASATKLDDGSRELTGSKHQFERLAGWLGGEANRSRRGRKQDELAELSESTLWSAR